MNAHELTENNTPFDVNAAIRRWRENLTQSPNFRADDLDELESHLRDSLRELEARGLSAEETFTIATGRIGSGPALAAEFARINGNTIWIDRMLWMLIGWASVSIVQAFMSALGLLSAFRNQLPGLLLVAVQVSPLILAALILKSLFRPRHFRGNELIRLWQSAPLLNVLHKGEVLIFIPSFPQRNKDRVEEAARNTTQTIKSRTR